MHYQRLIFFMSAVAISWFWVACHKQDDAAPLTPVIRNDVQPIENRFPTLAPVEKTWWEGEITSKNSRISPPGPSQYRMSGYVRLTAENAAAMAQRHTWAPVPAGWSPGLIMADPLLPGKTGWVTSEGLKKELSRPPRIMGDFYFNAEHRFIYFEMSGE